jgi:protein TonB
MSFTDNEILILFGFLAVAVAGIIFFMKRRFDNQTDGLASKYHSDALSATLKKYPEADSYRMNNTFFRVGLICAIAMSVLAFNWTTFESQFENSIGEGVIYIDDNNTPVTFPENKTPPPPPPPPVIEEMNDQDIDDDFEFSDQDFEDDNIDYEPYERSDDGDDKPKLIEEEPDIEIEDELPFTVVENMPTFPGCADLPTEGERKKCSDNKLLKYVYQNLKYPTIARENGIEGLVVARFIVGKDGKIQNIEIVKGIGGGCGEELERVLNSMNDMPQNWKAGEQRGRKVPVRFNIPIRFKLSQQ